MYDWHENIKIEVFKEGFLVDSTQFHNIITDDGLTWLADSLRSTHCNKIYYLGWGASSAAASTSNTALSTETGRKLVTAQTSSGVGVCITTVYLGPTEAVGSIKELGWFAGTSASATALSGTMLSRVVYERNKTALESLTITRTDTLIRTTS